MITTYPQFHLSLGLIASAIVEIRQGRVPSAEDMRLLETAMHECTGYVESRENEVPTAQIIALNARRSKRQFCKGDAR